MLMPRRIFQLPANNNTPISKPYLFFPILIFCLIVLSHGSLSAADTGIKKTKVIIDVDSRVDKEQNLATEIAGKNFNNTSTKHKLDLHVQTPGSNPPQAANPDKLKIAIPGQPSFDNFVKIKQDRNSDKMLYTGFCISVFEEVQKFLKIKLPYEFHKFDGSYDDLIASVANKTYDAAVGDITITAERWASVEYTEPFTESGLMMVVPTKPLSKGWIFLEPFTWDMWLATGVVLIYTMFTVWFLERQCNPDEFGGPLKDSLGNALWFTFSSLFLAHREKIRSNHARVVVVMWLFVALILTQSYTANLTSMLTISRLQPNVELIRNESVGCDENSFMKNFAVKALGFRPQYVKLIRDETEYLRAFENGTISAALLEIPYAKVFVNKHCGKYDVFGSTVQFGGFGFVFQKGSQIAANVSKAILEMLEDGTLKQLERDYLLKPSSSSPGCYADNSQTKSNTDSLSFQSFWGLFIFSIATSSVSCLLFIAPAMKNYIYRLWQEPRVAIQVNEVQLSQILGRLYLSSSTIRF